MPVGVRRSFSLGVMSLCALVGVLLVLSAPVLAAAPEAPALVSVEGVTASEATFQGVLNPGKEGAAGTYELGTYEFLYAKSPATCEGKSRAPESPGISLGGGMEGVAQSVSGLEAGTEYTVCLLARDGIKGETVVGPAVHFTTAFPFVEAPEAKPASPIAETEATLHGVLNPKSERAAEPGSDVFVYRQSTTECQRENPETGQKENEKTASAEKTPEGHEGETAEAKLSELSPGTTYTFCLRVVNKAGEEQVSPPKTFTTLTVALTISGESVTEDSATAAKLNAQVDPGGAETTYHFEYDTSPYTTSAPHGQGTPESPSIGADNSLHPATAAIQGLQPGTTYHYRLVATNSQSPPGGTDGPDQTFTTETTGGEFALPDGRAYELVSPPQKDGAEVWGSAGVLRQRRVMRRKPPKTARALLISRAHRSGRTRPGTRKRPRCSRRAARGDGPRWISPPRASTALKNPASRRANNICASLRIYPMLYWCRDLAHWSRRWRPKFIRKSGRNRDLSS